MACLSARLVSHPHVIAEEAYRAAELCIGQDMSTMTVFAEMEAGIVI
jgi:hypothetical protein